MSGKWRVAMALSVAGMVLLPLFGLLLRFQPSFVHGLHLDARKAERNCYLAAGCYGALFVGSALALSVTMRRERQCALVRQAAAEDAIYGPKHKKDDGDHRPESRTSSREATTIMLDSPHDPL